MIRSYCSCGWEGMDDENDTNFNSHVFNDFLTNHRMCSFGEWKLCKENYEKDVTIENLQSQLENNCSEEVVVLREKVLILEKQVENLKEKLYTNKNGKQGNSEQEQQQQHQVKESRLTRRRRAI